MEVHAPDHPVLTFKQFLVHIFIVTIGILIALSLEGAREWWHHRELVHETRINLRKELEGNQQSIKKVLESIGPVKAHFIEAIDIVSNLPAREGDLTKAFNPAGDGLLSGVSFAWLNTASYKTAQVTGALGLLEYSEAFTYSDIYDLQDLYLPVQEGAEKDMIQAYMLGTGMLAKHSPAEAEAVTRQLRIALSGLIPTESLATKLSELYDRALKEEH